MNQSLTLLRIPEFSSPNILSISPQSLPWEADLHELSQWASLLSVYQLGLVNGESRQGI